MSKKMRKIKRGIQLKLDSVWIRYTKASKSWGGRRKKTAEERKKK